MRRHAQHAARRSRTRGGRLGPRMDCATCCRVRQARSVIALCRRRASCSLKATHCWPRRWAHFTGFRGKSLPMPNNCTPHVRFVIEAASSIPPTLKRDQHLRSKDFLFVDQYPTITFTSTALTRDGLKYMVQGDLEMRGVTKRITIPVAVEQRKMRSSCRGASRSIAETLACSTMPFLTRCRIQWMSHLPS